MPVNARIGAFSVLVKDSRHGRTCIIIQIYPKILFQYHRNQKLNIDLKLSLKIQLYTAYYSLCTLSKLLLFKNAYTIGRDTAGVSTV